MKTIKKPNWTQMNTDFILKKDPQKKELMGRG
jgi:hypothetical protein